MRRQLTILHADAAETLYCGCEVSVRSMTSTDTCRHAPPSRASQTVGWSPLLSRRQLDDLAGCAGDACDAALDGAYRDLQLWAPMRQDVADALSDLQLGTVERASSGVCNIAIDDDRGVFTPPPAHRGRIARVLLYLQQHYDLAFDNSTSQLLLDWHFDNPPVRAETALNRWLTVAQGKGVSTSKVSIEDRLDELRERVEGPNFDDRIDELREEAIEKIDATRNAVDPAGRFSSAQFYVEFYVNMSADGHAHRILQGDESAWQSLFDGLEIHWLASQKSQYKVGDVEVFGKMMALAVIAGERAKAEAYAAAYLHPYNQRDIDNYIYDNHYPDLARVIARLIHDDAWPTDVDGPLADLPYGRMLSAGRDDALFAAALYDSGNDFLDLRGTALPYFRLTPFEFLAIVKLRSALLGAESPRLAHPVFKTTLADVPAYETSNDGPVIAAMEEAWGQLAPVPELFGLIEDKDFAPFLAALDDGADPNARDHLGRTPLTLAAELNLVEFVGELVRRDADTSGKAGRALHSALGNGNAEMTRMLLEAGVDVNYVWEPERGPSTSAFGEALANPNAEIIGLLLEHGFEVGLNRGIPQFANLLLNTADPGELRSIVDVLIDNGLNLAEADPFCQEATLKASAADLNYLIDKGADVNKRYIADATPLICAARNGSLVATRVLLDRGADTRARNRYGDSALSIARDRGYEDIAQALLSYRR